jgi:hypothetical protein
MAIANKSQRGGKMVDVVKDDEEEAAAGKESGEESGER